MPVEDYLPEWEAIWEEVDHKPFDFFAALLDRDLIDQELYTHEVLLIFEEMAPEEIVEPEVFEVAREKIGDALFERSRGYFAAAFHEVLVSLWQWMLEKMKDLIDLVVGKIRPVLQEAWDIAKARLEEAGRVVYDGAMKLFEGHSPITPEDAPVLALKLYTLAWGAGMTAHGISVATELLHPLKQVGLNQAAALVGDFAGFGRITGATMGTLVNRVLGRAMTYAVQNQYRPVIPDERLLIELRSKREIDKPTFDKAMGYEGFSKDWIDVIERWQWKDPRMFELMRVADIGIEQGPPPSGEMWWFQKFGVTGEKLKDWWLYRKLMRAGYEDIDLPVLIRTIHRREISFAMTYVRTAIRRNYRWGYLTDEELTRWIDRLMLPEQAKEWILWAGQLDRDYFHGQNLIRYYKLAYRNDIIDEDELMVSLLAMGQPARETMMTVRTERVRKSPKVRMPVAPAAKKAKTELQKKSITLYITQYRKDLITSEKLLESLLAIGLSAELAEISVDIEAAKKGLPAPEI
jgi:hypothetical protein